MINLYNVRMGDFIVHILVSEAHISFSVYPFEKYSQGPIESLTLNEFMPFTCAKKMGGVICYRGTWDERVYFTDDEYWGEELEQLSRLYNDEILPWCNDFLKQKQ